MSELLNMDRLDYIGLIRSSGGAKSIDIAEEILKSKNITNPKEITKENIKVNKRLRKLVKLGILESDAGKYKISNLGNLLIDSWEELRESKETLEKFSDFFKNHYVTDLPREFFLRLYKLKEAQLTEIPIQWVQEVVRHMRRIEHKFYNVTEYLHDIPEEIIERTRDEKGERIDTVIIYEFLNFPQLNYSLEEELFNNLVKAGVQFRYIELKDRHPIGVRIVDDKWATFGLPRLDGTLDREQAFIGTDKDFVIWCRDLTYHLWHFEAKPLNVDEIVPKKEK